MTEPLTALTGISKNGATPPGRKWTPIIDECNNVSITRNWECPPDNHARRKLRYF